MPPVSSRSKIRAVTFDVGGTLLEPWPSVGAVYAAVAAEHGVVGVEPGQLTRAFVEAWRSRSAFDYQRESWYGLVRQAFGGVAVRLPAAFFPAVYERFARAEVWRVYEDVGPALEALVLADVRLAVISNWDERLRPLLVALGLDRWFEVIVISQEVGFQKPSSVIFEQAYRSLGLAPGEILHVGDSVVEDLEGPRAVGMQSVRIQRSAGVSGLGFEGGTIGSLEGLGGWVAV